MKIESYINGDNKFKIFNDSMGVALFRDNIIRSRKLRYMSYLTISIAKLVIATAFLALMLIVTYAYYCMLSVFLTYFAMSLLIFIILSVIYPLLFANCFIIRDKNELEITENGVSFYLDDDQYLTLGWTHIRALVIGKHSINFITDGFYYFYLDKAYSKEVLEAIEKYNKDLLIIK